MRIRVVRQTRGGQEQRGRLPCFLYSQRNSKQNHGNPVRFIWSEYVSDTRQRKNLPRAITNSGANLSV